MRGFLVPVLVFLLVIDNIGDTSAAGRRQPVRVPSPAPKHNKGSGASGKNNKVSLGSTGAPYTLDGLYPQIGKLINIQTSNLWDDSLGVSRASAFAESNAVGPGCIGVKASSVLSYSDSFSETKKSFSKTLAESSSIDATYFTASVEGSQSYTSVTKSEEDLKILQMDTTNANKYISLQDNCARELELDPDMMEDWIALPANSQTACWSDAKGCRPFLNFVKAWGTHIIMAINTGARISYFTMTKASSTSTQRDMTNAMCAKYSNPPSPIPGNATEGASLAGATNITIKACVGFNSSSFSSSSSTEINNNKILMGGTSALSRATLSGPDPLTSQQLSDFLATSDTSDAAISYEMKAVWKLITDSKSQRNKKSDNEQKIYVFEQLLLRGYFIESGKVALPKGTWTKSCSGGAMDPDTGIMSASCRGGDRIKDVDAKLGYFICSPGSEVDNTNGRLSCQSRYDTKPAVPGGTWKDTCSVIKWRDGGLTAQCSGPVDMRPIKRKTGETYVTDLDVKTCKNYKPDDVGSFAGINVWNKDGSLQCAKP